MSEELGVAREVRVLSRPAGYLLRPWQRVQLPQRLSARAAIIFCTSTTLLLWLGIVYAVVKLF